MSGAIEIEQVGEHLRLQDGWNDSEGKDQQEKTRVGQDAAHVQLLEGKSASIARMWTKTSEPGGTKLIRNLDPRTDLVDQRPTYIWTAKSWIDQSARRKYLSRGSESSRNRCGSMPGSPARVNVYAASVSKLVRNVPIGNSLERSPWLGLM